MLVPADPEPEEPAAEAEVDYRCDHGCGYCGSYAAVERHELICPLAEATTKIVPVMNKVAPKQELLLHLELDGSAAAAAAANEAAAVAHEQEQEQELLRRAAAAVAEQHTIDLARLKAELEAQDEEIRQLRELQQQMETAVAYAYYAVGKEHGQQEALAQQANAAAAATD
jgi:hypothetical protein